MKRRLWISPWFTTHALEEVPRLAQWAAQNSVVRAE